MFLFTNRSTTTFSKVFLYQNIYLKVYHTTTNDTVIVYFKEKAIGSRQYHFFSTFIILNTKIAFIFKAIQLIKSKLFQTYSSNTSKSLFTKVILYSDFSSFINLLFKTLVCFYTTLNIQQYITQLTFYSLSIFSCLSLYLDIQLIKESLVIRWLTLQLEELYLSYS